MPIISIEGNIGSGKSTLLERIHNKAFEKKVSNIQTIPECLDIWEKIKDGEKNILELFYENKKKYAVPFQMLTFLTITYNLMGEMQRMTKDKIVIIERSPISNIEIFGRMLYDDGIIGEAEWSILKYMANGLMMPVDKIVYLRSKPDDCMQRVRLRERDGEESITIPYLDKIHKRHEEWLSEVEHETIESREEIDRFIDGLF